MKESYTRWIQYLRILGQAGGHFLWPGRCQICKESIQPESDSLCQTCWQGLSKAVSGDYCRRCGRDVSPYGIVLGRCGYCQDRSFEYDRILRVGRYESTLRSMILALKFAERIEWTKQLSKMMQQTLEASGMLDHIDTFVPVPLHWRRKIKRGFNQSQMLAKGLKLSKVPISEDLVRIRNTVQQWDLTESQRRRNVKGAFAVRRGHCFKGKTVALIDDISTSGATLAECAKALKTAGANKVIAIVAATAYHD